MAGAGGSRGAPNLGCGPSCLLRGRRPGVRELVQARRPSRVLERNDRRRGGKERRGGQYGGVLPPSRRRFPREGPEPRPRCPPRAEASRGRSGPCLPRPSAAAPGLLGKTPVLIGPFRFLVVCSLWRGMLQCEVSEMDARLCCGTTSEISEGGEPWCCG